MTPQQLNLSPESLTALLQALTALNLTSNVAAPSSATPSDGAITTVAGDGASVSSPSSVVTPAATAAPASSGPGAAAAPPAATTARAPASCSATAAPPAVHATHLGAPIVLHSPFTGLPLPAAMQPVNATVTVTESSVNGTSVHSPLPTQVHSGFHCSNCGAFNPAVGQTGETYYVVMAGREVGIFTNWEKVQPLVSGVPHACHKKYRSRADAEATFAEALAKGKVRVL
ncbi:hypothetical protein ARMSODRAFT_1024766 [Armillaria solidipes]|uniref:Ribonuclease H1 N-terminal domain-containing protein n=1 Tax=Armillaria solidipes TaxID=1076256 RepID=A0A2H3BD98_9AGAR|nr:hypothetical protein ARMSODRAFT_1024766 [Armillaria solidipes]